MIRRFIRVNHHKALRIADRCRFASTWYWSSSRLLPPPVTVNDLEETMPC